MTPSTTILISAGGASEKMLRTCLKAIERHKEGETTFKILVIFPSHQSDIPWKVCEDLGIDCMFHSVDEDELSGSRVHADMLDIAIKDINTPYVLTLDADCFPMSAGWLDRLHMGLSKGAAIVGIAHPYASAPDSMSKIGIEYRIRSQLCYDTPHVACMLMAVSWYKRMDIPFSGGDDTGLGIIARARSMELSIGTIMPTACALPGDEFNRSMCVIYDNCIYHHGGGSREEQDKGEFDEQWKSVRDRVVNEGADFLIDEPVYEYKFDNEEKVADEMAAGILRGMRLFLQDNDKVLE